MCLPINEYEYAHMCKIIKAYIDLLFSFVFKLHTRINRYICIYTQMSQFTGPCFFFICIYRYPYLEYIHIYIDMGR